MLDFGKVEAIIVKVATLGLEKKHLGMNLRSIKDHLHKMVIENSYILFLNKVFTFFSFRIKNME